VGGGGIKAKEEVNVELLVLTSGRNQLRHIIFGREEEGRGLYVVLGPQYLSLSKD
jgi:hypothetical protein